MRLFQPIHTVVQTKQTQTIIITFENKLTLKNKSAALIQVSWDGFFQVLGPT